MKVKRDPIAHVEFRVWHNGYDWSADQLPARDDDADSEGTGSTPITALMVAEAKARKAAR